MAATTATAAAKARLTARPPPKAARSRRIDSAAPPRRGRQVRYIFSWCTTAGALTATTLGRVTCAGGRSARNPLPRHGRIRRSLHPTNFPRWRHSVHFLAPVRQRIRQLNRPQPGQPRSFLGPAVSNGTPHCSQNRTDSPHPTSRFAVIGRKGSPATSFPRRAGQGDPHPYEDEQSGDQPHGWSRPLRDRLGISRGGHAISRNRSGNCRPIASANAAPTSNVPSYPSRVAAMARAGSSAAVASACVISACTCRRMRSPTVAPSSNGLTAVRKCVIWSW